MSSGFSFSNIVLRGGMALFMVGRVGHSQECAGSYVRYANLHGLPPPLAWGAVGFKTTT